MASRKNRGSAQELDELEKEIELLKQGGWGQRVSQWFRENFVSLVLPIIAIVVLVAGILFYSGGLTGPQTAGPLSTTQQEQNQTGTGGPETDQEAQQPESQTDQQAQQPATEGGGASGQVKDSYTLTAQAGDGITHLARRALAQYLKDLGDQAPQLTPEHLIYAEDFVQNATGDFWLNLGQQLTFAKGLLQKAIDASLQLTPEQLNNLKQFSRLVPSLS